MEKDVDLSQTTKEQSNGSLNDSQETVDYNFDEYISHNSGNINTDVVLSGSQYPIIMNINMDVVLSGSQEYATENENVHHDENKNDQVAKPQEKEKSVSPERIVDEDEKEKV